MDKKQLNWNEIQFIENLELLFGIVVLSWQQDIQDGNLNLIPDTIDKAKEDLFNMCTKWTAISPYKENDEWKIYQIAPNINVALIRHEVVKEFIDELFMSTNEVLEIGIRKKWIVNY